MDAAAPQLRAASEEERARYKQAVDAIEDCLAELCALQGGPAATMHRMPQPSKQPSWLQRIAHLQSSRIAYDTHLGTSCEESSKEAVARYMSAVP